ncbi:MAG: nitroreductase [Pseudomonadota bacterium]
MKSTRRQFLAGIAKTGAACLIADPLLSGCSSRNVRQAAAPAQATGLPAPWMHGALHHAAMAPSGHNSQPWQVEMESDARWIVRIDPGRMLPAVDPDGRESLLSVGAFLETLAIAAAAGGQQATVAITGTHPLDPGLATVTFRKAAAAATPLERIRQRRTLKSGQLPREIRDEDVAPLTAACGGGLHYFPRSGKHATCIAEGTVEAFRHQSRRDDAQKELARWVRFTPASIAEHGDGLTPAGMEVGGVAGIYMRFFMTPEDVTGDAFRTAGVDKTAEQVSQGGGWLIITSPGNTVGDIIDAGRRFQRMALLARERSIAVHPMTQLLEEPRWRDEITRMHGPGMVPQFILRVGYVDRYPDPVSPRRPVGAFTRVLAGGDGGKGGSV